MTRAITAAKRNKTLGDESTVETNQRHYVGNGTERNIVEQRQEIEFQPVASPETPRPQHAIDRNHGHKNETDRRQMPEAGKIVAAVRIDDRNAGGSASSA